jgi:hypothetical protein
MIVLGCFLTLATSLSTNSNFLSTRMDANTSEVHTDNPSEAAYSEALVVDEPVLADDDWREYPEFDDQWDRCDDEDVDEMLPLTPFDETDEEERAENVDMGMSAEEEDEDKPIIAYDRDNPSLSEGSIFPSMVDCRNALSTFCIKGQYDFVVDKSDATGLEFTAHT